VDRGDFAAAVDRHYPGVVQRLTLVLHDAEEAKDVAQEAYLKAFQAFRLCRDSVMDRIDGYVTQYDLEDELYAVESAVGSRPEFGGIYLSDEKGARSGLEIVLLTTSCAIEDRLPEIEHSERIRIVLVERTYEQLKDLQDAISEAKLEGDPATAGVSGISLNVTENVVEVRFLDDTPPGRLVAAGGRPAAFADAFGTEGIRFSVISREDLPVLMPAPALPSATSEAPLP
jgi:hypothetical protein